MTQREKNALMIIDRILSIIDSDKSSDRFLNDFYLECCWFQQEIKNGDLKLPMENLDEYLLRYIIAEDYFDDGSEMKKLTDELYDALVDIDI